jgi:predicted TIM-barrel fold metal-dependent hydrolase
VPGNQEEEHGLVRGENDWVVQQVTRYPGQLVGFCGVNPLRDYAVREIQRCKEIGLRGLKLHFSNPNTDLDFDNIQQLAQLKVVFSAADQARMPIIVHLRPRVGRSYGAAQARSFIETVLPAARNVPVQIAHMAGYGADPIQGLVGYDRATDEALGAFIAALHSGQIKRHSLYFDFSGVLLPEASDETSRRNLGQRPANQQQQGFPDWIAHLESRIREIGIDQVLFGSSWPESTPGTYQLLVRELTAQLSLQEWQ